MASRSPCPARRSGIAVGSAQVAIADTGVRAGAVFDIALLRAGRFEQVGVLAGREQSLGLADAGVVVQVAGERALVGRLVVLAGRHRPYPCR
ncbi:hypothetical protein [Sphingomonas aerophila]|uniref:Uncharacterized protein n=1 Tax=Sphingomonas aerophila TaxID=1344948 RepID=A0A7W9BCV1_9SPHN|nr:hypothetical protein [Sphingomonas aerophila]MBB5714909.1 hypothetical protein [Sphingomonas aerophila]